LPEATGGLDQSEKVGEKVGEKLTDNQVEILRIMKRSPAVSAGKLASQIGISRRKTEENIRKLREMNLLRRIGPDKGGHWEVVEIKK
jgi:ATP-dependent DNA helicase RecG